MTFAIEYFFNRKDIKEKKIDIIELFIVIKIPVVST